jgi:DNA-binding response OmpR family regulator
MVWYAICFLLFMGEKMLNILLVEDDHDIREVMMLVLGLEGFKVTGLADGYHVAETVRRERPDIVLLDAMLGDMDGRDICRVLKSATDTQAIPIMIVSASHGYFDPRSQSCGANDYLAKPFDIHELVARVKRLAA